MKLILFTLTCFLLYEQCLSQVTPIKRTFADTELPIIKFRELCNKAWEKNDDKLANTYYDSIKNCIVGSYVANYKFKTINNRIYTVGTTRKPIFLIVSASWCKPCQAEIPALNKLVDDYADRVNFLVLFWDLKKDLTKLAKQYNRKITLVPSIKKNTKEVSTINISGFRHQTGYPSMYAINLSNQIVGYSTGASVAMNYINEKGANVTLTEKEAFKQNYKKLKDEVELLIEK